MILCPQRNSRSVTHGVLVLTLPNSCHNCDTVIVNHNSGKLLVDCISSVLEAGAWHAIVVDNDSSDGSVEDLERAIQGDRVIVIRNGKNVGFAAACNIGAQSSNADRLLFLNPDCVLGSGALGRLASLATGGAASTGGCGAATGGARSSISLPQSAISSSRVGARNK